MIPRPGLVETSIKWAAELAGVREVSLRGSADLGFWTDRLARENLQPIERDGHAQVLIVAADSRFNGIRFRESSFSILVVHPGNEGPRDAAFLLHAYNSSRLFAFCERVLFSTPYDFGRVRLSVTRPASVELTARGGFHFRARMAADSSAPQRQSSRRGANGWDGSVFLPRSGRGTGKFFFARLRGDTDVFPFLPAGDLLTFDASSGNDVMRSLVDSHFAATEWFIRPNATHAKSKTYNRSDWFPAT